MFLTTNNHKVFYQMKIFVDTNTRECLSVLKMRPKICMEVCGSDIHKTYLLAENIPSRLEFKKNIIPGLGFFFLENNLHQNYERNAKMSVLVNFERFFGACGRLQILFIEPDFLDPTLLYSQIGDDLFSTQYRIPFYYKDL